jgi:hypothetical protein
LKNVLVGSWNFLVSVASTDSWWKLGSIKVDHRSVYSEDRQHFMGYNGYARRTCCLNHVHMWNAPESINHWSIHLIDQASQSISISSVHLV